MSTQIDLTRPVLIVGLGVTGLACARYLRRQGTPITVTDSRPMPPGVNALRHDYPDVPLHLGEFIADDFIAAEQIIVSPGVSPATPLLQAAQQRGIPVISEIELFAQQVNAPVIAITGSNGKSTVTTLVGQIAQQAGWCVAVGGNLGTPAIALLDTHADLYVLELSSFQLELTYSLRPHIATVLNLSADHQDRHPDFASYVAAKQTVFRHARIALVNRDDPATVALITADQSRVSFGLNAPEHAHDWGVVMHDGQRWLIGAGTPLLPAAALRMAGLHNVANALAAAALANAMGISHSAIAVALASFKGLPHRCEYVAEYHGIRFINDSKGTNPGATVAALVGIITDPTHGKAVLIAGGDGKGADFTPLIVACQQLVRAVILIGRDGPLIADTLGDTVPLRMAGELTCAVVIAAAIARPGDCVLLSPACASFDQFRNYQQRGDVFSDAVQRLIAADLTASACCTQASD